MGKRREKRSRLAVPIRIKKSAEAKSVPASGCTLDVAPHGARVQSTGQFEVGDELVVERGMLKARFKVMWVGGKGTNRQGQIGIQCVDEFEWATDIDRSADDYQDGSDDLPRLEPIEDRVGTKHAHKLEKGYQKHRVRGQVDIRTSHARAVKLSGQLRDLSARGFFVVTEVAIPLQTHVVLCIKADGLVLEGQGAIRTSDSLGMWVDFTNLTSDQRIALQHFIEALPEK